MNTKLENKVYLGFLNIHILYHADKEPVYGIWMIEELNHHGYNVGASHIYPLLKDLTFQGLLTKTERLENGKIRKYYSITEQGKAVLSNLLAKVKELSVEVL